MTETTDDGTDGPTDQAIRDLIDAERHRELVEERRRRARHGRAEEAVAFVDVFGALAAHRSTVTIRTLDRTLPTGQICEVGRDYVALRCAGAVTRLVPLDRIASATAAPTRSLVGRNLGQAPVTLDLAERLRELVGLRARIHLTADGALLAGRLRQVGADLVVLEHEDGSAQFVALAALDDVVVAL